MVAGVQLLLLLSTAATIAYASEADDVGAALCYNVRCSHTHFSRTHTSQHKSVRRVQHINHH